MNIHKSPKEKFKNCIENYETISKDFILLYHQVKDFEHLLVDLSKYVIRVDEKMKKRAKEDVVTNSIYRRFNSISISEDEDDFDPFTDNIKFNSKDYINILDDYNKIKINHIHKNYKDFNQFQKLDYNNDQNNNYSENINHSNHNHLKENKYLYIQVKKENNSSNLTNLIHSINNSYNYIFSSIQKSKINVKNDADHNNNQNFKNNSVSENKYLQDKIKSIDEIEDVKIDMQFNLNSESIKFEKPKEKTFLNTYTFFNYFASNKDKVNKQISVEETQDLKNLFKTKFSNKIEIDRKNRKSTYTAIFDKLYGKGKGKNTHKEVGLKLPMKHMNEDGESKEHSGNNYAVESNEFKYQEDVIDFNFDVKQIEHSAKVSEEYDTGAKHLEHGPEGEDGSAEEDEEAQNVAAKVRGSHSLPLSRKLQPENNSYVEKSSGFDMSIVSNSMITDEVDHQFKQIIFELNSYPKSLLMIDISKNIIFYNQHITLSLFYDKSELINTEILYILDNSDPEHNYDFLLDDIISQLFYQKMSPQEVGEHLMKFVDKEQNTVQFYVKFNTYMDQDSEFLILYMDEDLREETNSCSIDPRNLYYLIFSMMIGLSLLFLVFYVPYDIAFGDASSAQFNIYMDMVITSIFTLDILLNFFVAFEDSEGRYIYNSKKIVYSYLAGSFILDTFATVPFEYLFNFIAFNTNIIKSVRILKVFKLVKILRVSKYLSFIAQKSSYIEQEIGKENWMMVKKSSGFFELMLQNFYILIGAHYYTIVFFYVKDAIIENKEQEWLSLYYNINYIELSFFNIYMYLLAENVKTALGLAVISPTNMVEIAMNILWMFIGLSLFGYGIGNISSYLNNIQQDEIEYMNAISYFRDLCETNELDHRIYQVISAEVDQYYNSMSERKFYLKGKILSNQVMIQLETALYKEYMDKFKMFSYLNISTIRFIKTNTKRFVASDFKYNKGSVLTDILLITQGKLTIYSDSLSFMNEYNKNEMYGLDLLKAYCLTKYKIDFDTIYEEAKGNKMEYERTRDMGVFLERMNQVKEQMREIIKSKVSKPNEDQAYYVEEDWVKVSIQNSVVASADLQYYSIPFKIFEEIFFNDIDAFLIMWRYNMAFTQKISEMERQDSHEAVKAFTHSSSPAFMLQDNADVYDINTAMYNVEEADLAEMLGNNLFNYMYNMDETHRETILYQLNRNELQELELIVGGSIIRLLVKKIQYFKILRGEKKDEHEDELHYYNLKKSMLGVKIIYFKIDKN